MVLEPARRAPCRGICRGDQETHGPGADRARRVPTAPTWFGYASVWTCALAAAKANSLKAIDMAKALQDFHLPPEIALGPNPAFYRAGQNQLLPSLFVGNAQPSGSAP